MFHPEESVLVGVSGGPDSIAMLHVLLDLSPCMSLRLGVAHVNHCLRHKDSDNDAQFVESLAKELGLPFYIKKEDVLKYQKDNGLSQEEAARRVRYAFYYDIAKKNDFGKIALGHHADDNAELVLMYLFRGSGPLGLSGIPPVRDNKIVRPLIKSTRSQILDFLEVKGLDYVTDISNTDVKYLRNRIRHHLIPALKEDYNPAITQTLNRLSSIIRSEEEWIEEVIEPVFKKTVLAIENKKLTLCISRLKGIHVAAQRRIIRKAIKKIKGDLRRITFSHIDSAICLMENGPDWGSLDFPDRVRIKRTGDHLLFSKEKHPLRSLGIKKKETLFPEYKIFSNGFKAEKVFIKETGVYLSFTETGASTLFDFHGKGKNIAFFDINKLHFPLTIRSFQPGDRFTPLGMSGTQKVKKFFINNKIPPSERSKCLILTSGQQIIWIVGHRIDESVKVTSSTNRVLKAELLLA
ncbi:MAG: tRNA lysidine(34) synthetase TilS [Deltaproteobacteria bacterium]|nr:tRNA lysidine(34) synthetase TilS [Deltaproteobacteria bacterium]